MSLIDAPGAEATKSTALNSDIGLRRVEWIDAARGIGIVLVVYGHVLRGLGAAGFVAEHSRLWLSDYAIYTFHMPLFFLLAGLNVEKSLAKGRKRFLLAKLWTIAYPYFLWSTVQIEIQRALPGLVNHPRAPFSPLVLLWSSTGQFWFLYSLFVCHMVALAVGKRQWFLALLAVGTICLCALGHPATSMFAFYVLGIVIGDWISLWTPDKRSSWLGVFGCLIIFALTEHFGRKVSGGMSNSVFSFPAAIAGIALTCFAAQVVLHVSRRCGFLLTSLGVMSMTIYVLHVLADASARILLKRLGLVGLPTELIVGVVLGIVLPILVHLTLQKLNLLTVLGLAPLRRSNRRASSQLPEGQSLA